LRTSEGRKPRRNWLTHVQVEKMTNPVEFRWRMTNPVEFSWRMTNPVEFRWRTTNPVEFSWRTTNPVEFNPVEFRWRTTNPVELMMVLVGMTYCSAILVTVVSSSLLMICLINACGIPRCDVEFRVAIAVIWCCRRSCIATATDQEGQYLR